MIIDALLCDCDAYRQQLGMAYGWTQCSACGYLCREQDAAEQTIEEQQVQLVNGLRRQLQESWRLRQPGGGVSRKQWALFSPRKDNLAPALSFFEAQQLTVAREAAQHHLRAGCLRVELWEISADGLCSHAATYRPPWALPLTNSRRGRPSGLADGTLQRTAAHALVAAA